MRCRATSTPTSACRGFQPRTSRKFAAELFQVQPDSITIGHMAKDAVWSVEGDYTAERSAVSVTLITAPARASRPRYTRFGVEREDAVDLRPVPGRSRQARGEPGADPRREEALLIKEQFRVGVQRSPPHRHRSCGFITTLSNNGALPP